MENELKTLILKCSIALKDYRDRHLIAAGKLGTSLGKAAQLELEAEKAGGALCAYLAENCDKLIKELGDENGTNSSNSGNLPVINRVDERKS